MSVWQTPQPATSMITSSGDSFPGAVSAQSNWPLATNLNPLIMEGFAPGWAVVIGSLLPQNSKDRSKMMCQGTLVWGTEEVIAITSACDLMAGRHFSFASFGFHTFRPEIRATRLFGRNFRLNAPQRCGTFT